MCSTMMCNRYARTKLLCSNFLWYKVQVKIAVIVRRLNIHLFITHTYAT